MFKPGDLVKSKHPDNIFILKIISCNTANAICEVVKPANGWPAIYQTGYRCGGWDPKSFVLHKAKPKRNLPDWF